MPSTISPSKRPCPICGKPAAAATAPFCSQGCKDRDLLQWLSDGHRLPGPAVDDPDFDAHGVDS